MSEDKNRSKWAGEIYDTLRIFRRISNTIYGLLLVEIGWLLLLLLLAELVPVPGQQARAMLPTLPWLGWPAIDVRELIVPGLAFFAVCWAVWSKLILYVWLPLRNILRTVIVLSTPLLIIAAGLINVLLLPLTYPAERIRVKRWLRTLGKEDETRLRGKLRQKGLARLQALVQRGDRTGIDIEFGFRISQLAFRTAELDARQREHFESMVEQRMFDAAAIKAIGFDRWVIAEYLRDRILGAVEWLGSRTYIAFAPLQSFSYEEDLNSSKAPAQVFSAASERLCWRLQGFTLIRHFDFDYLPTHRVPKNSSDAATLRKLLGLDVLLWGSYLPGNPTSIWLNIEQERKRAHAEYKDKGLRPMEDLFPGVFETHYATMIADQREPLDVYIALVVALLQTLQARHSFDKRATARILRGRFWDRLRYSHGPSEQLVEHLVFDAFPQLSGLTATGGDGYPTPQRILVEITGRWIGYKIDSSRIASDALAMIEDRGDLLTQILRQCIELEPEISENHYRYGVMLAMKGATAEAINAFTAAKKAETARNAVSSYELAAQAELNLSVPGKSTKVALATYAGYAARAINIGTAWTKKNLREELEKSTLYELHKMFQAHTADEADDERPLWIVIEHLLSDRYSPGPAASHSRAGGLL